MAGANLSLNKSRQFTPFSYLGTYEAVAISSDTTPNANAAFDAVTPIDLKSSMIAYGENYILATCYNATLTSSTYKGTGIIAAPTAEVTLDLYMLQEAEVPTSLSDKTLKVSPLWVKIGTQTKKLGEIFEFTNLYSATYKLVPFAVDASLTNGVIINAAWNDESIIESKNYIQGLYGEEGSLLPPNKYVNPSVENIIKFPNS